MVVVAEDDDDDGEGCGVAGRRRKVPFSFLCWRLDSMRSSAQSFVILWKKKAKGSRSSVQRRHTSIYGVRLVSVG